MTSTLVGTTIDPAPGSATEPATGTADGHRLTEAQRRQWAIDGYLLIKGALDQPHVARLTRALDALYDRHVTQAGADPAKGLDRRNVIEDDDTFVELIDHPAVFGIVLDLLDPYIQLSMAEAVVRPPNPEFKGYIHTDGGPALQHIRVTETSLPLQLKIQYFLTDVREPNNGNFTVVPGSHLRPYPEGGLPAGPDTPGTVQLCVEAGDAVFFPHSLWHGPARTSAQNMSREGRKSVIYCYSQMCFRPFDFVAPSPELLARCTPRQRRLLGDLGPAARPGAYFYSPKDQVELMHGGAGAAAG